MEIIDEFMHMLKHDWERTLVDLFKEEVKESDKWCPFIHNNEKNTNFACSEKNPAVISTINFLENLYLLCDYLELPEPIIQRLEKFIVELKLPHKNETWYAFKVNLDHIEKFLVNMSPILYKKIKKFTCLECDRVWESIRCFNFHSYYASTILIISALEGRLHTLIESKNKTLYKKEIKNFTFGKILALRDPEQYKEEKYKKIKKIIQEIIPEKHVPLIKLLNHYRILSAHPNLESINKDTAKSIITLAFAFLLDEELEIPDKICTDGHAPAK